MPAYLHPGVYVREIPSGARAIEGVPTSTTIFVGETERGPVGPTKINGLNAYERLFGGYRRARTTAEASRVLMRYALDGFFRNGGTSAYILRAMDGWDAVSAPVAAYRTEGGGGASSDPIIQASSPGIWGNSLSVTVHGSSDEDSARFRLVVFYSEPGFSGTDAPKVEDWDRLSIDPNDESYVVDVLKRSLYIRWNEDHLPTAVPETDGAASDDDEVLRAAALALEHGTGGGSVLNASSFADLLQRLAQVDDAALLVAASDRMLPEASTAADDLVTFQNHFIDYVVARPQQDLFYIGTLPRLNTEANPAAAARGYAHGGTTLSSASNFNALYWPHVRVPDPVGEGANPSIVIPPSGYVAGLYGRTDARRGVWKAPAGVDATLGGVLALDVRVLDRDQDNLNPVGINALRQIPSAGLVIWGARTRQPSSEWRYVPVRRTAIFLRKSIYNGIQWAVFEPNDEPLWQTLRATIGGFMETQFRNGAFAGATSKQAYFVKCDAETTTELDQAAGIVNIQVGFAPLRPAEFVVVTLSQKVGQQAQ